MLVIPCKQGTEEWFEARLGKLTASSIRDILPMEGEHDRYYSSRDRLLGRLIGERISGRPRENYVTDAMRWGTEHEAEAREKYSEITGHKVVEIGFVAHPTLKMAGCSPDGLIDPDGLVEIKCPTTARHELYIAENDIPDQYLAQLAWQLVCTGRQWVDFFSYDPRSKTPTFLIRMERKDELMAELNFHAKIFLDMVDRVVKATGLVAA